MLGLRSDCPNDTLGYNHCPVFYTSVATLAGTNLSQYPSCHLNRVEEGADRTYFTKVKYATSYRVTNSHF